MAEISFARTFLTTLDSRPIKLPADHVEDQRNYPARQPYILPRMPKPMSKPAAPLAPGQERAVKVTLKSLRNPPLDITLPPTPPGTSIHDIKSDVSRAARIPAEKLKILYNKKPVPDSKVLKDLIGADEAAIEFSVMVIGGAAAVLPPETQTQNLAETEAGVVKESAKPAGPEPTGAAALETEAFWADLKGFLSQRLKDEAQAQELSRLFKTSWESKTSNP